MKATGNILALNNTQGGFLLPRILNVYSVLQVNLQLLLFDQMTPLSIHSSSSIIDPYCAFHQCYESRNDKNKVKEKSK